MLSHNFGQFLHSLHPLQGHLRCLPRNLSHPPSLQLLTDPPFPPFHFPHCTKRSPGRTRWSSPPPGRGIRILLTMPRKRSYKWRPSASSERRSTSTRKPTMLTSVQKISNGSSSNIAARSLKKLGIAISWMASTMCCYVNLKLYPHSPHFNTFYCINAVYRGPGPPPVFDSFLDTITGGNPFMKQHILEIIGCCLVPSIKSKSFFVLQGCQDSGKSKLAEFIRLLINREASTAAEISTLDNRFTASEPVGKQLCLSLDMPSTPLKDATVSTL